MSNLFKRVSVRKESVKGTRPFAFTSTTGYTATIPGADLFRPLEVCPRPDTSHISFLRTTMRAIHHEITSKSRRKNGLAKIIAQSFEFDNTRVYIKDEDTIYLLGEHSRGPFRNQSTYANGRKLKRNGKNKILQTLEEMSAQGQYILSFDLRYALFLWEDDPQVAEMIETFNLERDEEKIELMKRISPNKDDVLRDINYYLFYNRYLQTEGKDPSRTPLETTFVALVNGENQVHGYIMANNFITGRPLDYDTESIRDTAEVILDTYKIYATLQDEKRKAQEAERKLMQQNMELQQIAITDDLLTNIFSKRYFQKVFKIELDRAQLESTNIGLTFIDIDHFKKVNDTYGHEAGDTVLKGVADIIKEECREADIPCRYGGEEIVIFTTSVESVSELIAMAKRIRTRINSTVFDHKGKQIRITLSIGIAMGNTGEVLTNADEAMYYSKENGRNKLVIHHHDMAHMQPLPEMADDEREYIVYIE